MSANIYIHPTLKWAFHAHDLLYFLDTLPINSLREFGKDWTTVGGRTPFDISAIRHTTQTLIEHIELWIKERVLIQLQYVHGANWWASLPRKMKEWANRRHELAVEDFGLKAVGPKNIEFLSFGNVISLIEQMDSISWKKCLFTQSLERESFSKLILKIKSFRDNKLAHPGPEGPTPIELRHLARMIEKVPTILSRKDVIGAALTLNILDKLPSKYWYSIDDLFKSYKDQQVDEKYLSSEIKRYMTVNQSCLETQRLDINWILSFLWYLMEFTGGELSLYLNHKVDRFPTV